MKKIILFFIVLYSSISSLNGQDISASLGNGTFVEGITPVTNTINVIELPNTVKTVFYATDASYITQYDSFVDNDGSDGFNWEADMGILPSGTVISAEFFDASDNSLGYSNDLILDIISTPSWINNGGSATNVTVSGSTIELDAVLPILSSSANPMPNDVPGLSSRPYEILNSNVKIHIQYDYTQAASNSTLTNPSANFELNVFNQINIPYTYQLSTINGLTLDNNFNLAIQINGTYTSPTFKIKFPAFRFPVGPIPIAIKIDGGIEFNASITGQLVFGFDNNSGTWGFIDIAGEKTKVTAKINGEGTLRVSVDALVASVGGSIIARGSIGGGFNYVTIPTQQVNPLFGISLEIAGALDYKLGIGWLSKKGRIEKTFYSKTWGDQLKTPYGAKLIYDEVDAKSGYTATIQNDPAFEVQNYFSQPSFSANNDKLYTVWLDYDGEKQKIQFAELDYNSGVFSQPLDVITNKDVISNPKVAIMPSGSALITWTESRYNTSNFDSTNQDLSNILKSQDIWATIYDNNNGSFLTPFQLSDDVTSIESGRSDGNANVIMGKGNYGLITWVAADIDNNSSDIYFCTLEETGSAWNFGNSQLLVNLPGTNRNVNVAYTDSLNAIASWINDPDGSDSTYNSEIVFQIWNGTNWSAPQVLIANDGMTNFDELSMDFNDIYGSIAYTSTHYNTEGEFEKRITAHSWDVANQTWGTPYTDSDTSYYFSKPKVAVNRDGYTALTYQAIQLYADTLNPDEGVLYMILNDAQNPNTWVENTDTATLGDPNVYVADIVTSFDNGNNLFMITQEADEVTGQAPIAPINGVRFGNNYLNLVLRAFTLGNDLDVSGTSEPNTSGSITKAESYDNKFSLVEAYPNPFTNYTNIKYSLTQKSNIKIEVFDFTGRPVSKLFEGTLNEGIYTTLFEPNNLLAGIYFCRITINNSVVTKKLVVIK
jgi:hypothetical protein